MTYKNYQIRKKEIYPEYIKFELNDNVEFGDGNHNFIFCINEYPFNNYQGGDVIEVDLTGAKLVSYQSYHQGIVRKIVGNMSGDIGMDDYSSEERQSDGGVILGQDQLSAYDKKTVHKLFRNSLEWLEKYIEVTCPDYKIKKQIHDNNIKIESANDPNKVEELFIGSLFGFKTTIEIAGKPKFLYDEVKQEFYKWSDSAGVDVNRCPLRLKHLLFEVNEVLEGRGGKLERDIKNRKWEIDPNSREYEKAVNEVFTYIQNPLENERGEYENLKNKTYKDVKIENNFGGSGEKAEQDFRQIAGKHDYQGFSFLPQKERQQYRPWEQQSGSSLSVGNQQQSNLEEQYNRVLGKWNRQIPWDRGETSDGLERWIALLQFKLKKEKWRVDWVKNFKGSWSQQPVQELALIHPEANLNEESGYNQWGYLKDADTRNSDKRIIKVHLVKLYPADQQKEIRAFYVNSQYEIVQKKLGGEIPLDTSKGETSEGLTKYKQELEVEIRNQQNSLKSEIFQSQTQPSKSNNNQFPTTPLIIGSVGFGFLLFGIIVYKVRKNKIKK